MAARGGRFFVMYGQTEATARIAYVPPDRLSEKLGSAGIAIPGGRLSIEPAGAGTMDGPVTGEVVYEGPNVMLGYATGSGDLALGDELGGVLRTGDIGYLDEDGFLFLVGRSKRIAKVFGLRINLDEVEAAMREHGPGGGRRRSGRRSGRSARSVPMSRSRRWRSRSPGPQAPPERRPAPARRRDPDHLVGQDRLSSRCERGRSADGADGGRAVLDRESAEGRPS